MGLFAFSGNYNQSANSSSVDSKHETRKPGFGDEPAVEEPKCEIPKPEKLISKTRKSKSSRSQAPLEVEATPMEEVRNDVSV